MEQVLAMLKRGTAHDEVVLMQGIRVKGGHEKRYCLKDA